MSTTAILHPTPIASLNVENGAQDPDSAQWLDRGLALFLIIFLAPLLIATAIAIVATSRGKVFFRQARIGRGGQEFQCYKFRTMEVDAERRLEVLLQNDAEARREWAEDQKLRNDPRITSIGTFLRKSSIDELPQLFNVLKGDMRLVGPRPIVQSERQKYGRYFREYCSVRPGITGLWQVSGRNDVSYRRRVAYDVLYSKHRSFLVDLGILFATIPCVLFRRGSY
ncbi:sugar transferase [Altererythrobacter lutimaris]|uniref:sugar transferase n=1 Tax=Altererythrobacter lutimaris TaxID=2743979 RepID=UPI002FC33C07